MSEIKGTNLASGIVPFTTEDEFATHYSKYGNGGWHEVADITERDAITDDRLTIGMAVYVLSENKLYIYKGKEEETEVKVWEEFTSGITGVAWGDITGSLSDQTDLNEELTGLGERIDGTEDDISDIQDAMDGYGDIVTHNAAEFQPAGDYATTSELSDLADLLDQEIEDRENADSDLQDQIDNLSGRGRFLSLWNCAEGKPTTEPEYDEAYTYKTGDYFIVGAVASGDGKNYKPTGTTYTKGQAASTVEETDEVSVDDTYYYDGSTWHLQVNHGKTVSFANLAGQPSDNTALANALDGKQDTISDLADIRTNASAGAGAATTIAGYGDIVTHNASEFLTPTDIATTSAAGIVKPDGTTITVDTDGTLTATAQESNYRGKWNSWADVPSVDTSYPADYHGETTPTENDYIVISDTSDFPVTDYNDSFEYSTNGYGHVYVTYQGETLYIPLKNGESFTWNNKVLFTNNATVCVPKNISGSAMKINDVVYQNNQNLPRALTKVKAYCVTPLQGSWRFAYHGTWSTDNKNGWTPEYQLEDVLPLATDQEAGIAKLYTSTGTNTDGSMDQNSITAALAELNEVQVSTTEPTEESVEVWINPEGESFDINTKQDKLIPGYGINITNYPKILPNGYTQLEYVESNATQFVDTGITYNSGDNMKIVWEFKEWIEYGENRSIFGAVTNDMNHPSNVPYGILGIDMLRGNLYISGCTSQVPLYNVYDSEKHSFEIINQNRPLVDGKSIWQGWDVTFNNSYGPLASASTVALFGCHRNSLIEPEVLDIVSTLSIRIYEFEIENKCKLIPAKNPDGIVGFYDTIRNIFITTDRGDALIPGNELLDNVISSTIKGDSNSMGGIEATPAYTLPEGYQALQYIQNTGVEMFELPEDFYLGQSMYTLQFDFRDPGSTSKTGSLIGKRIAGDEGLYRVQREPASKFYLTEAARQGVGGFSVVQTLCDITHGGYPTYDNLSQRRIDYIGVGQAVWDYSKIYRNSYTPTQNANMGKMGLFGIIDETLENKYVPITTLYRIYRYVQKSPLGKIVTFLIPVRNKEGVVGMFDLVSQQFLDSVTGVNNFIAGPDIDYNNGINIGSYVFYDGPDLTATPDKKGYIKVNIDWSNSHGLSNRTAFNSGVTGTLYERRSSSGTTGGKHNFSYQTVIGYGAEGGSEGATAYGSDAKANALYSVAIGRSANAKYNYSISIGYESQTVGQESVSIGHSTSATYKCVSLGYNAKTTSEGAIAIGANSSATGTSPTEGAIAIGVNSSASGKKSIQLGSGTNATEETFQVGSWQLLNMSNGKIPSERIDFPETATALSELTDVSLSSLANGQSLVYNNGVWSNAKAGVEVTYDTTHKRLKFA